MTALCNDLSDHVIAAHYKGMVTKIVRSFEGELPKTLFIVHFVMKRYVELQLSANNFYTLQDLMPTEKYFNDQYDFSDFERAMRYAAALGLFEDQNYRGMIRYKIC